MCVLLFCSGLVILGGSWDASPGERRPVCKEVGVTVCATEMCPSMYLLLAIAVLRSRIRARCFVLRYSWCTAYSKLEGKKPWK